MAVSYSPDFHIEGNGLWTLDLRTDAFEPFVAAEPDRYFVDPVWSDSGDSVFATSRRPVWARRAARCGRDLAP